MWAAQRPGEILGSATQRVMYGTTGVAFPRSLLECKFLDQTPEKLNLHFNKIPRDWAALFWNTWLGYGLNFLLLNFLSLSRIFYFIYFSPPLADLSTWFLNEFFGKNMQLFLVIIKWGWALGILQ